MTEQEKKWWDEFKVFWRKDYYAALDLFLAAKRQDAERIAELEKQIAEREVEECNQLLFRDGEIAELRAKLEAVSKERDELAAQVEVMRDALQKIATKGTEFRQMIAHECLRSITGPAALREIQARTLESIAKDIGDGGHVTGWELKAVAAAKRKGE